MIDLDEYANDFRESVCNEIMRTRGEKEIGKERIGDFLWPSMYKKTYKDPAYKNALNIIPKLPNWFKVDLCVVDKESVDPRIKFVVSVSASDARAYYLQQVEKQKTCYERIIRVHPDIIRAFSTAIINNNCGSFIISETGLWKSHGDWGESLVSFDSMKMSNLPDTSHIEALTKAVVYALNNMPARNSYHYYLSKHYDPFDKLTISIESVIIEPKHLEKDSWLF